MFICHDLYHIIIPFVVADSTGVNASGAFASTFVFSHLAGISECGVTSSRGGTSGAFIWVSVALVAAILSSDW